MCSLFLSFLLVNPDIKKKADFPFQMFELLAVPPKTDQVISFEELVQEPSRLSFIRPIFHKRATIQVRKSSLLLIFFPTPLIISQPLCFIL